MTLDYAALLEPIAADAPCGIDLDLTGGLTLFDGMRIFGQQLKPLGDLVPPTDPKETGVQSTVRQYRWREVLDEAGASLVLSKDIRVLAYAGAAAVRVEGLESFTRTLELAAAWLDLYWDSVYPRLDPEADARSNALYSFADKMAVLDAVRRVPLAVHKQMGSCSFRDIERAWKGEKVNGQSPLDPAPLFAAVPVDDLISLEAVLGRAIAAIASIESRMRAKTDNAAVPDLSGLADLIQKMRTEIIRNLDPRRPVATPEPVAGDTNGAIGGGAPAAAGAAAGTAVGAIRSREDAIRALDAVAEFFRVNEPSSPVPLFIERSKRLISMGFLELLADVAPAAVAQAKAAAGLPSEDR